MSCTHGALSARLSLRERFCRRLNLGDGLNTLLSDVSITSKQLGKRGKFAKTFYVTSVISH